MKAIPELIILINIPKNLSLFLDVTLPEITIIIITYFINKHNLKKYDLLFRTRCVKVKPIQMFSR